MPNQLTVLIPCKDEIKNIRPCIESLRSIADEIIVADSGSSDGTLDVVRSMGGCKIIEREYVHSGHFKNWAIPQCAHPWVLIVDADERVTPELADEIKQVLEAPTEEGYKILRRNFFLGHEIKHCGWHHDAPLRLFRRDIGRYSPRSVHADVIIPSGRIGTLKAKFLHYTYWSMEQYLEKLDRYTMLAARDLHDQGRSVSAFGLLMRAPARFFSVYVLRRGFLDGVPGLVLCILIAFYSFTKQAKLWALRKGLPQPDPEAERSIVAFSGSPQQESIRRAA